MKPAMNPEEEAGVAVLKEAYERWADMPPVQMTIDRADAFALVLACQGMITHPAVSDTIRRQLEHLGRQIQEGIADTADVYTLLEAGWNRDLDITPECP